MPQNSSIGAIPINLKNGDPADQIPKLEPTGVQRACDMIGYECVNSKLQPEEGYVINQAIKIVAVDGGIDVTGVYWAAEPSPGEPLASEKLATITINITAGWRGTLTLAEEIWLEVLPLIEMGRSTPSFVVESVVSIEQGPEAYAAFSEHRTG